MKDADATDGSAASHRITTYIAGLADWRGPLLARLRTLILEADPEIIEEWKWDTAVWSRCVRLDGSHSRRRHREYLRRKKGSEALVITDFWSTPSRRQHLTSALRAMSENSAHPVRLRANAC